MSEPKRYSPSIEWDEDTNQKESVMIECVGGSWIKYSDYARLKAEVERLTENTDKLCKHGDLEIERLKAEVERLRKAGDAMVNGLFKYIEPTDGYLTYLDCRANWNAAKEGKQS